MKLFRKKILVFSRLNIDNYGDPIIADCCKYIIEKTAIENHKRVDVSLADIYEKDPEAMKKALYRKKVVVFPGGGMNSVVFNKKVLEIFKLIEQQPYTSVFFNAIGILKVRPNPKNEKLLIEIFNKEQVKQVTTRGDLPQLEKYIHEPRKYPQKLIFDPAIWVNEAYQIQRNTSSDTIGIGVIRPEIYAKNGNDFSEEDVLNMYVSIIRELDARGHKWQLFCNGMKDDYKFGKKLLKHLGLDVKKYLGPNVANCKQLVQRISGYQAIIAARLHANIIATSLEVPSIGLVWNDKMNLFADIIGSKERYIQVEDLLNAPKIVDEMENAIKNGYDLKKINAMKEYTVETIKNIVS